MIINKYQNGNCDVELFADGTRIINVNGDSPMPDYPFNIDIRVTSQCSFGLNPKTQKAVCYYCHESATTNGSECNYFELMDKLVGLPKGIELAIGGNNITDGLQTFLKWATEQGYVCNLTVNQGHLIKYTTQLKELIQGQYIRGLGVSYKSALKWNVPQWIIEYENTVFHVIAGIDDIDDVMDNLKCKKILVLGEKDFGFNEGQVDLNKYQNKKWVWKLRKLFDLYDVVSFDNLAIEQLKPQRFITIKQWQEMYQGEYSMYINAVDGYFSDSSRSPVKVGWDTCNIPTFFKNKNC